MSNYKIRFIMDQQYKVVELFDNEYNLVEETVFCGSLSCCEAWIRLHEGGYM